MLKKLGEIALRAMYYLMVMKSRAMFETILRTQRHSFVVLCYHGVNEGERAAFGRQMDMLLRAASPVHLGKPVLVARGKSLVAVTFDDGFACVLQNALPELKTRDIPVTLFLPSGNLGSPIAWEMKGNWPYRNERLLTRDELLALKSPLVTIGSHSVSHADLTKLSTEQIKWELCESKQALETTSGSQVELFAFPYGRYTESIADLVRTAGYRQAFTTEPEISALDAPQFLVGRFRVDPRDWRIEFWLKVRGAYAWHLPLQRFRRRLRGLALYKTYQGWNE